MPWLAALFLRAFFFRDFLAMAQKRTGPGVVGYGHPGSYPLRGSTVVGKGSSMADEIRAEMVANVWKVVKSPGDEVAEGDVLVILESMKMEIPVVAESDGTVAQIAVSEGDVIQEGDLIAVIE